MEYVIALGLLSFVGVFVWIRFFKSSKHTPKPTVTPTMPDKITDLFPPMK